MEATHPLFKHSISIDRGGTRGQLRKEAREAPQPPPVHSLNAVSARGGIRLREAPALKFRAMNVEVHKRDTEPSRNRAGRYIAAIRNARRATHSSLPRIGIIASSIGIANNTPANLAPSLSDRNKPSAI
jgi:hypothetical protein